MPQPTYSPDLARVAFLPKLKTPMKGKRLGSIEEIKGKSKQELLAIPKSAFHKCFEDLKKCWHKYIYPKGVYFAGNKIVIDK